MQLEATLVRPELTARLAIPLVETPRVAEFDRVTGPISTWPRGVHLLATSAAVTAAAVRAAATIGGTIATHHESST